MDDSYDDGNWRLDDLLLQADIVADQALPMPERLVLHVRPATYGRKIAGEYTNFFWHLGRERRLFRCALRTIIS